MSSIQALDRFEIYYAEKLWEMIPEVYRHEDGLAQPPGVLRAMVEILAQQAAVLRRSQDRLWEDQFIEWCYDWAVPYLGDLVGTRMVSALNLRGRRVDVAKTIYYRRRKGTPRVLEELISDIAGWEGKVVEEFKHLGRARHGLDPAPLPYAGPYSGTLPGGWADIRRPLAAQFVETAFDEYFHTPDVRRHRGLDGRMNIPKLAFHLFRLTSRTLIEVTPFKRDAKTYTFDPSGRDAALFSVRQRQTPQAATPTRNWEAWTSAQVWELPLPILCRVLGHAEYQMDDVLIAKVATLANSLPTLGNEMRPLRGQRFISEDRLYLTLKQLPSGTQLIALVNWSQIWTTILTDALIPDCGKNQLIPKALEVKEIPMTGNPVLTLAPVNTAVGNLSDWSLDLTGKPEKWCIVDPTRGRLKFIGQFSGAPHEPQQVWVTYHYAFPGPIGAGTYARQDSLISPVTSFISGGGALAQVQLNSVAQIQDSLTYGPIDNPANFLDLVIQAANAQRPYLRLEADLVFKSQGTGAHLTLEGLWIGNRQKHAMILQGDFERVTIRHCTLDPGGKDCDGQDIFPVSLQIEGHIDTLVIEASVLGPVSTQKPAAPPDAPMGLVEKLEMQDSILQSLKAGDPALYLELGAAEIDRSTILGSTFVHQLWASEVLAAGPVTVMNTQNGCFRFSAALRGSRLPHPYESHILQETAALFTSTQFGHWGFAQVAESAPESIRRGAENGSELGAFSACLNPIKMKSLQAKVEEYMPFGLIPIYIPEV
jgi:hypothetical protein